MTIKQARASEELAENGGNVYQAMIKSGYSKATAKTPQKLLGSKGFQQLVKERLPDDKLLQAHEEALEATKIYSSPTEPDREIKDHAIRLKAVELGYKLKGNLVEHKEGQMTINVIHKQSGYQPSNRIIDIKPIV